MNLVILMILAYLNNFKNLFIRSTMIIALIK